MKKFKIVTLNEVKGLIVSIFILLLTGNAYAFNSGSTGALGAFNPTANTEVTLPADGILNYTTVNIPTGVTVTFKKNANVIPVYILASGDVTIVGTISVNGTDGNTMYPGKGGPGGFDGGLGGTANVDGGKGLGPGGGNPGSTSNTVNYCAGSGGGGGFGSSGSNGSGVGSFSSGGAGGGTYGNLRILPMIGGSGGGGGGGSNASGYTSTGGSGGGGGGAILIASSGIITVNGSITANGGKGGSSGTYASSGGGGSGGAIKLTAVTIAGNGAISASGGAGGTVVNCYTGGTGGNGRIRIEANDATALTAATTPAYTYGYPSTVFVTNIPTLSITTVGGIHVLNPTGKYGSPDVILPSTISNPVTVEVSATNIPVGTQVTVTAVPEYGSSTSTSGTLSGTDASSTASASITLSTTYQSILTATATFTVQTAMYWDDEKIEKVRVAATMGKESEVVYITEKGREIKSGELMARFMGGR